LYSGSAGGMTKTYSSFSARCVRRD
jgi:hypothetical protein